MSIAVIIAGLIAGNPPAPEPDYLRDLKPILATKCYSCHGAIRQKSGLRLDAVQLLRKGSKSGPIVVPGKPDESKLLEVMSPYEGERAEMPPESEGEVLTAKELALFRAWIQQGAKAADEVIPADPKSHWAYQPPKKGTVPGSGHPIDAFLTAARAKQKLIVNPVADKPTLLRRVHLDLIGVPPTPAELHAFLNDTSTQAFEKVVDRLLASPMYGERWGRHWLDIWRYSDPFGLGEEYRYSQRHIWKWRDWVVESLNADKGYDRMIIEMLAGDEVAPNDPNTLRATGYLARNWYKFNRNIWLQDTVEYTAAGFLGVTLRCARCHDHKYDPISQSDYYRFRAFFEPHEVRIDAVPGQPDTRKDGVARAYDAHPETPTYLFERGDERSPDTSHSLLPGVPGVLGGTLTVQPVRVAPRADLVAAVVSTLAFQPNYIAMSTGRRLALAKWIANARNPLTARVAVNHIWMRHFGSPLVPSVANFGLNGKAPTHPQLLDWLAADFTESGWSMKKLHRLIVTSEAYRLSSRNDGPSRASDPDNHFYWRADSRRVEAEAVRDSLLFVAGQLDRTMGGPIISETQGETSHRRSIYFRFNTEYKMQFLDQFDAASPTECYERRESIIPQQALALRNSTLALNAARTLAKQLSAKFPTPTPFVTAAYESVLGRSPTLDELGRCEVFLRSQTALYTKPGKLTTFPPGAKNVIPPSADPKQRACEDLIHVLFNHNDFVTSR